MSNHRFGCGCGDPACPQCGSFYGKRENMKGVCPECGSDRILFVTIERAFHIIEEVDEEGNPISFVAVDDMVTEDDDGWYCESCQAQFDHAKAVEDAD